MHPNDDNLGGKVEFWPDGAKCDMPERGRDQGCINVDIRLWKNGTQVWGSQGQAAWWNDNDTKDNC